MMSNYDLMWSETMPDDYAVRLKKSLWFEHLSRFRMENVMRAAKEVMIRCPTYPPRIGEMVKLCEEFSATSRYNANQLEDKSKEPVSTEESKLLAEQAREEIRRLLRLKHHAETNAG